MSKLTGIFDLLNEVDYISPEEINQWLPHKLSPPALLNFIGNRALYPESIAITNEELEIDLAIFRELVKKNHDLVLDGNLQKIILDQKLVNRFPPLSKLATCVVEVLPLPGVTRIFVRNDGVDILVGSVVTLATTKQEIKITLPTEEKTINVGNITLIPLSEKSINIKIGQDEQEISAFGGELGVIFDTRN
jgi:hypothetical protein